MNIVRHRNDDYPGSPAEGFCTCGTLVMLSDPLDNVCDNCGRCYNSSGQMVTPSWQCDEQGEPYANPRGM